VNNPERTEPVIEPALLSIKAAAEYLSLSQVSIYRLIGLGHLQAVKAGKKTLVVMSSIKSYLASLPPAKIKAAKGGADFRPRGWCGPRDTAA
jgi:excisionase family DNA binding protein